MLCGGHVGLPVCNLLHTAMRKIPSTMKYHKNIWKMAWKIRGATNAVAGMILDYRAFDTFGESTVLFVAVAAVVMLMKRSMNKKG